jgi:lipopolysaccharide/colanic/teichoic acid biosynthesis glycosyltransferase
MRYLPFYTVEERIRFAVRPGMTGWAQVNGRHEAVWADRLRNDIWYVQNRSFLLDIRILGLTIYRVVRRENVTRDARSPMLDLDDERAGRIAGYR